MNLLIFLSHIPFELFIMLVIALRLIFKLVILRIKIIIFFGKLLKHFFIFLSFMKGPFKFLIVFIDARWVMSIGFGLF